MFVVVGVDHAFLFLFFSVGFLFKKKVFLLPLYFPFLRFTPFAVLFFHLSCSLLFLAIYIY